MFYRKLYRGLDTFNSSRNCYRWRWKLFR